MNGGTSLPSLLGQGLTDRTHAAFGDHPSASRTLESTHVVHQEIVAGAFHTKGCGQSAETIGDRIHGDQEFRLEAKPMQVVLHGLTTEAHEDFTQFRTDEPLGGFLEGKSFLQPSGRQVFPQQRQFRLKSRDGIGIGIREERTKLRVVLLGIGPQQQRSPIQRGQKIVGVTANQFQRKGQSIDQLGRHHPQQIRAGGMTKFGGFGKRPFGSRGSPQHRGTFQHVDPKPSTGQEHRCRQAVVPRTQNTNIARGHHAFRLTNWTSKEHGPAEARPRPFFLKSALLDSNQ